MTCLGWRNSKREWIATWLWRSCSQWVLRAWSCFLSVRKCLIVSLFLLDEHMMFSEYYNLHVQDGILTMTINLPMIPIEMIPPWNNLYRSLNSLYYHSGLLSLQFLSLFLFCCAWCLRFLNCLWDNGVFHTFLDITQANMLQPIWVRWWHTLAARKSKSTSRSTIYALSRCVCAVAFWKLPPKCAKWYVLQILTNLTWDHTHWYHWKINKKR